METTREKRTEVIRLNRELGEKIDQIAIKTNSTASRVVKELLEYALQHATLQIVPKYYYIVFDDEEEA